MSTQTITAVGQTEEKQAPVHREPLQLKGVLDQYDSFDVTPIIGREFSNANLKEWLRAPNSDELIRDLAITGTSSLLHGIGTFTNNGNSVATRRCLFPKAGRP